MDLRNLKTFIFVAEQGSFTRAAARLGYSQSTVSFQIRQIEEELGVRLFERIRHTVNLTDQGREVLRYAHQVDKLTAELGRELREEKTLTGHVRIAMADSLCNHFGTNFQDFWRRYPGIHLKITAAGTEEMFRLLSRNEVDLVFTLDNHIYNTEYRLIREEKINTHFVAAPSCPLAGKKSVQIGEVITYPFLLTEQGMSYRRLMDETLAARSMEVTPVLETGNTETICRLTGRGAGIAFLPDYATDEAVEEGWLVRLEVEDFQVEVWKQLFCHRDKWISPHLQAVMTYCAGI